MFTRFARSSAIRRAFYTTEVPSGLNEGEKHIFKKLSEAFSPIRLQVADVSGGCGSMYAIEISSKSFEGTSIVKQHRMVNDVLKEEIKGMHGLQLRTSAK